MAKKLLFCFVLFIESNYILYQNNAIVNGPIVAEIEYSLVYNIYQFINVRTIIRLNKLYQIKVYKQAYLNILLKI